MGIPSISLQVVQQIKSGLRVYPPPPPASNMICINILAYLWVQRTLQLPITPNTQMLTGKIEHLDRVTRKAGHPSCNDFI